MLDITPRKERVNQRVRVRLTREGWQFLLMLSFIVFAAIIQNINLLVLISGAFAGILLLQWRLSKRTLVGLKIERFVPSQIEARHPFQVELQVENPRRWLGSWLIGIQESIGTLKGGSAKSKRKESNVALLIPHVYPESTAQATYECQFARRGRYIVEPTRVSTIFPFSLTRGTRFAGLKQELIAIPARGHLVPSWRSILNLPGQGGNHRQQRHSNRSGTDGEFYGMREFRTGDSPRFIHWRTSAKRNHFVVKQMERLDDRTLHIVLDLDRDGEEGELATELVATMLTELVSAGKPLTFSILGEPEALCPVRNRVQLRSILERLAVTVPNHLEHTTLSLLENSREVRGEPLLVITTRNPKASLNGDEVIEVRSQSSHGVDDRNREGMESSNNIILMHVPSAKCSQIFQRK
jgi:uncharacterized protein (DUF58 family)